MTRPSPSTIAVAGCVALLVAVLVLLGGDVALAQQPPSPTPIPDIGKNARTQILGGLAGIFGILLAVKALQHSGDRNVPGAALSFLFLTIAAYMIFAPDGAKNTLKAVAQSIFP